MTPFQGRTLRQAAWLGCLACLACLPSSLTLRTSLVGEWSTSPQDCSEERRPTLHFTENTVSATLETYENCEDGELLWTIHHFGPYYKHSDSDRKMVYDGSRETQDAEAFYFGQSTHQLIPNSVQGAAVLTTKIMSATQEECPDKDALLPLSAHAPRDITYLRCPLLGFQPVYNCTTTHRLLYVDDTDRLWVSGVGNGDKLYAACDKAVLDTATFATAPLKKVLDAPSLRGDWNLACQSVQPAAGQHSFTAQFTIAPPYYSLKMQIYSGGSCEDANLIMEDHDFGSLEIGARHPAENSFFELEVAGLQRFLVAPTDASVAKSNDLITGSTDCEHEIGTFKNGDFKPVQFASCEALCLRPEARRGVLTTGVKVEGTTMTMMWDTNALPTCGLSGTSGRAAFTKMSASDVDFGLGVPAYPFTPGAQNGWNTAFFFMAFGEALGFTPTDDKWAFMDSLLTMDFQMIVRGNWNFNPVVGTYAQLHEPCDDGHCRVGPIKRYLEAFNRSYEYIGTQNFRFEAFTPNTAVLSFESLIKSKHTTQDSGPVATVWIMRFNQGLLSTLDVHTDTMPYAEANCPSIVNCGLVGEARITKSSQNTIQNSTSITNKYPGTADPDSNITATNALIFILTFVVLVCLGYATRLVYKLRAGSTLQEIDLAVRR